jgi:hypothetical protein
MAKDEAQGRGEWAQPLSVAPPRRRPTPAPPLARGSRPDGIEERRPNRLFRRVARALALETEEGLDALDRLLAQSSIGPASLSASDVILLELGLRRLLDRGLSSLDGELAHGGLDALLDDLTPR